LFTWVHSPASEASAEVCQAASGCRTVAFRAGQMATTDVIFRW
jgi:hypothetical protein